MTTVNRSKLFYLLLLYFISTLLFFVFYVARGYEHALLYLQPLILFLILFAFFYLQREVDLFSPMTLFSIFYCTIIPAAYYLISRNFQVEDYATHYWSNAEHLFQLSMFYVVIGYVATLLGYRSVRGHWNMSQLQIKYDSNSAISDLSLRVFIPVLFLAGAINFAVNVVRISGGDIADYMSTISIRNALAAEISHTTVFYLGTYTSVYLLIFYIKRHGLSSIYLILPTLTALLMLFSTGRVFTTVSYVLSIMAIYYHLNRSPTSNENRRYILLILGTGICSLVFYFYRLTSSYALNEASAFSLFDMFANSAIGDVIQVFVFEKGNIPNIPVLMKIIDSWEHDIGYLYGSSLVTWITNFLPSAIRPEGYQPSMMIRDAGWFPEATGAHPPTGIGEMYANFGALGPFIGMFLFGAFCATLRNLLFYFSNFWYLVIYCQVITGFVFLYSKGEFDNLSLWSAVPIMFAYLLCRGFSLICKLSRPPPVHHISSSIVQ
jgi:oligosaccharide repeat unit polymerase